MRICGREQRGSIRARRRTRGLRCVCVGFAVLALAVWFAPARAAAGGKPPPAPGQLWRSYPLDSAHTSDASKPASSPAQSARESQASGPAGSSQTILWLAVAAALVAMLATAATIAVTATRRARVVEGRLPDRRTVTPSAELKRAWFGLVDGARSFGAMLREEAGSLAGPRVEFATPTGPDPSGTRREGDPKAQRAAVKRLKEKRRTADREEVDLLKAKLGGTAPRRPVALRPRKAQIHAVTPAAQRCRIEWWRGYLKSEFYAQELRPDASIVVKSASFRWSKPTPPPETLPHVARAHAELVAHLEAAGWEVSGRGEQWYALELQRRPARGAGAERKR
jgi:hypothetical protein